MRRSCSPLAIALACGLPALATAQDLHRGLTLSDISVAEGGGVRGMSVNPASIVRLSGGSLAYQMALPAPNDDVGWRRTGHGVWAGVPLGGQTALGFAHERRADVTLPGVDDRRDVTRSSFTLSGGGPQFALGSTLHFVGGGGDDFESFHAWDFGVQWAPWRYLSGGAVAHNIDEAEVDMSGGAQTLPRTYEIGLGLRPFTERVTLGGGVSLVEDRDDPVAEASGFLELVPVDGLLLRTGAGLRGDSEAFVSATLGVDIANLGMRTVVATDRRGGAWSDQPAASAVALEVSAVPRPPLIRRDAELVEWRLSGQVPEVRARTLPFLPTRGRTLGRTLSAIERLARQEEVSGVLLRMDNFAVGFAAAEELRRALEVLRAAGKKVYVHLTYADHRNYLIASAADEVRLHPAGGLLLTGVQATFSYYAEALKHIGVRGEFIAIGEFKNAPDAFTRSSMSDAQREAEAALLDSVYADLTEAIARGRGRTVDVVKGWIAEGPYDAQAAKEAGLVDHVGHYDEWREALQEEHGLRTSPPRRSQRARWGADPRIAVIHVDGVITGGSSQAIPLLGRRTAGARTITRALDAARKDARVRAIVLRVNSPGGSATASESIHRAVLRAKEEKPVVVSMGAVAASGGYYVAAPASHIFADSSTVTGSIGIYAGKVNLAGLWDLLTVRKETLRRGPRADMLGTHRGFTDEEREVLTQRLRAGYDLFVKRVSEGRSKTIAEADEVARGRIWSGKDALAQGLVDSLGGYLDALHKAKELAGYDALAEDVAVIPYGRREMGSFSVAAATATAALSDVPPPASPSSLEFPLAFADEFAALWPFASGEFKAAEPLFLMDPWVKVE